MSEEVGNIIYTHVDTLYYKGFADTAFHEKALGTKWLASTEVYGRTGNISKAARNPLSYGSY